LHPETRKRETEALLRYADIFPTQKLLLITKDEESTIEENGKSIHVMPAWKWLLTSSEEW
jgi:predicted AAA+ superfamily ATPase